MHIDKQLFVACILVAFLVGFIIGAMFGFTSAADMACKALGWDTGGADGLIGAGYCRQETESGHVLECPFPAALDGTCLPPLETGGGDG